MTNLLVKKETDLSIVDVTADIDQIIEKIVTAKTELQKAVNMAYGVQKLKDFFLKSEELQKVVNHLAGTMLGFKTDKKYLPDIVTENCIIALLSGYRLHGNEFNIIANNFYPAKAGKFRKIIETPGLSNFREKIGMPKIDGKQAIMEVSATWKLNGNKDEFGGEVIVKIFQGSDIDSTIGKAQSKLYSRVLTQLTGTFVPDADVSENEEGKAAVDRLKNKKISEGQKPIDVEIIAQHELPEAEGPEY
jgi:hypothetical protein